MGFMLADQPAGSMIEGSGLAPAPDMAASGRMEDLRCGSKRNSCVTIPWPKSFFRNSAQDQSIVQAKHALAAKQKPEIRLT
jgi:hypothetical protein